MRTTTVPRGGEDPTTAVVEQFAATHGLSLRETGVLQLAAHGLPRKETAHRLGCSPGTVDTYWRRLLRNTGCEHQFRLFAALLSFAVTQRS